MSKKITAKAVIIVEARARITISSRLNVQYLGENFMNVVALLTLILAASALEICLSAWEHLWGLGMALGSFIFVLLDTRLFLLGIGLLALHIFYMNLGSLRYLILTMEARQRRGYIELMYTQHQEKINASIKHIS